MMRRLLMRGKWFFLMAVLVFFAAIGSRAAGGESGGWAALLANNWQEAEEKLRAEAAAAADVPAKLAALEGRAIIAEMLGKEAENRAIRAEMFRLAGKEPSGAFFFEQYLNCDTPFYYGDKPAAAEKVFSEASPALQAEIGCFLSGLAAAAQKYEPARKFTAATGSITLFARLSGTFAMEGPQDTDQPLPPQLRPAAADYSDDRGTKATVVENIAVPCNGELHTLEYLPTSGRDGEVILQAALESSREQDAILLFRGSAVPGMQTWLNTWPIFKAHYFHRVCLREELALKVRLRTGVNTLMLRFGFGGDMRVQVLDQAFAPLSGVKALPFAAADWENAAYRDVRGALAAEIVSPPLFAEGNPGEDAKKTPAVLQFWRAAYLASDRWQNPEAADDIYEALLRVWPQSTAVLCAAAAHKLRMMELVDDSSERLRQQAEEYYGRAEDIFADCLPAKRGRAEMHLRNEMSEQAIELLAPLAEKYPESAHLHSLLATAYFEKQYDVPAAEAVKAFAALRPDAYTDLFLFYEKQGQKAAADKLFAEACASGNFYNGDVIYHRLLGSGQYDAARQLIENNHTAAPAAAFGYQRAVNAWEMAANRRTAATLQQLVDANPADPEVLNLAAEEALRAGKRETAAQYWERSWQLGIANYAADPEVRRRLDNLTGRKDDLENYDISLQDVDGEKITKTPLANHATVLRVEVTRIRSDLSSASFFHQAVKPFDRSGVEKLGEMTLPKNDELIYCRTIQPDGTVFVPEGADNDDRKAVSMYNVKPGAVLEYAYRTSGGSDSIFYGEFNFADFSSPVARSRYVLMLPRLLLERTAIKTMPEDFSPEVKELSDGEIALIWEAENEKGLVPERFLPSDRPPMRRVEIRILGTNKHRASGVDPFAEVRSSAALEAAAREICGDVRTSREKLKKIFQWVSTEIHDGEESVTARDVFIMRSGNSEGRQKLCQAMLAAVGVRAYPVRANLRFSQQQGLLPKARMQALHRGFGYSLLAVDIPEENTREWVRFHDDQKYFRLRDIGMKNSGILALGESPWGLRLETVRAAEAEALNPTPPIYKLNSDGSAAVSGHLVFYGELAAHLRQMLENPHQARQIVQNQLAAMHPHITDLQFQYPKPEELNAGQGQAQEALVITYQGVIKKYAQDTGGKLEVRPLPQSPITPLILPLPRHQDVEFDKDIVSRSTAEYFAPEGWVFANVPADQALEADFGLYLQDWHVEGRRLTVTRTFIIPAQSFAAEHAEKFNTFLALVKRSDEAGFVLCPLPQGSACTPIPDWGECGLYDQNNLKMQELPKNVRALLPGEAEKN